HLGERLLSLGAGAAAERLQLAHAGFYELHLANGRRDLIAVNPDRRESDLAPITDEVLALWRGSARSGEQAAASASAPGPREAQAGAGALEEPYMRSRHDLWWYAMAVLLAAVLAESVAGSRYLGTRREAS
ncbi:MAG TPA: hypothetical protein VGI35_05130, partial [Steroidobacteraceae bacterium]